MMREQKKVSLLKKIIASLLTMAVVLSGFAMMSWSAHAVETSSEVIEAVDEIVYSSNYYSIQEYYSEKKAPVKENYVFGGWYQKTGESFVALKETEAEAIANGTNAITAYAKFVPAYVLSVKAQNAVGTAENMEGNTSVRIITSVDSKKYQKVGFEIYLGNGTTILTQNDQSALETSRVYKGIKIGTGDSAKTKTATEIFGAASQHVAVWELTDIIPENHSKIISVRPYWVTMDGTMVKGLAKYVHIEDDYKNYISVPVNLMTGETVAAGMMNVAYTVKDANGEDVTLELVTDSGKAFEAGRLLPQMAYKLNTDSATIKMVGNAVNVADEVTADGIYANVRFKKPTETCTITFIMTPGEFCDWLEQPVTTVKAWDITYAVEVE